MTQIKSVCRVNQDKWWLELHNGLQTVSGRAYSVIRHQLVCGSRKTGKFSDARARIRYDAHPPWLQSLVTRNLINKRNWISIRPSLPQNININLLLFLFVIFFQCDNDKINFHNSIGIWKLIQFAVVSHDYTSGDSAEYSKTFQFYDVSKLDSTST